MFLATRARFRCASNFTGVMRACICLGGLSEALSTASVRPFSALESHLLPSRRPLYNCGDLPPHVYLPRRRPAQGPPHSAAVTTFWSPRATFSLLDKV